MRNILSIGLLAGLILTVGVSCKKDKTNRTVLGVTSKPTITVHPMGTIVLKMDSSDLEATHMEWTPAKWGFPNTTARYDVEIKGKNETWDKASIMHMEAMMETMLTHFDLNDLAQKHGIAAGATGDLTARVKTFIPGANSGNVYSDDKAFSVTTFEMTKSVVTATPAAIVITKADAFNKMIDINWTEVAWDKPATTTYQLQMVKNGNSWANAAMVDMDIAKSKTFNGKDLCTIALQLGVDTLGTDTIWTRVKAMMPGTNRMTISDPVANVITTYNLNEVDNKFYFPGDYQSWSPSDLATVAYVNETVKGSSKFEGYAEMRNIDGADGTTGFKMTPEPDWDYDFGDQGTNYQDLAGGAGVIGGKWNGLNGPNFSLARGTYFFKVDSIAKTWSYELANWGLTGDATPLSWPAGPNGTPGQDHNMRFNHATQLYEVTLQLTSGKDIKFRKNDDWVVNRGDFGANGSLEQNGDNIKITGGDGTYKVTFDPYTDTYSVTKQ